MIEVLGILWSERTCCVRVERVNEVGLLVGTKTSGYLDKQDKGLTEKHKAPAVRWLNE